MAIVLLLVLLPMSTDPPVDPDVRTGVQAYEDLRYQEVLQHLERALARPDLNDRERVIALAYVARVHAAYGRARKAQVAFERVLELAPDFTISKNESPRIQAAFASAKRAMAATTPGLVAPSRRYAEPAGPPPMPPSDVIPSPEVSIDVEGSNEAAEGRTGVPGEHESLWMKPGFWAAVGGGVAVAVTVIAIVLATGGESDPVHPGTLGVWELP